MVTVLASCSIGLQGPGSSPALATSDIPKVFNNRNPKNFNTRNPKVFNTRNPNISLKSLSQKLSKKFVFVFYNSNTFILKQIIQYSHDRISHIGKLGPCLGRQLIIAPKKKRKKRDNIMSTSVKFVDCISLI